MVHGSSPCGPTKHEKAAHSRGFFSPVVWRLRSSQAQCSEDYRKVCRLFPKLCFHSVFGLVGLFFERVISGRRCSPGITFMLVNAAPLIKESSGQQTWIDLALPDLRTLARELRSAAIDEVKRADDAQGALRILLAHFGFIDEALLAVTILTPIGNVAVMRDKLAHIVEKRADSRERYVRHAIDTLTGPFEIWTADTAWPSSTPTRQKMTCSSW